MVKKAIMTVLIVLLVAGIVSAGSTLTLDELTKSVNIGDSVDFTVTLSTTHVGPGTLSWESEDSVITASLDGASLAGSGEIGVSTPPSPQDHTLTVFAGPAAIAGTEYAVYVYYCYEDTCDGQKVRAQAEAGVTPVPEVATAGLVGLGLVGLVALRRKK